MELESNLQNKANVSIGQWGGRINMVIDTHVHYYDSRTRSNWFANRMPDLAEYNISFAEIGINYFDIDSMVAIMTKFERCIGVVPGQHPKNISADTDVNLIFDYVTKRLDLYRNQVIGLKTGLDYHWVTDECVRKRQRELLRLFLDFAAERKMAVVLHIRSRVSEGEGVRQADEDMLTILKEMKFQDAMVLHCFNGNTDLVLRYLVENENTYFGIGGSVTYPNNERLIKAVKMIPRNRLLLETDGPYLKPIRPDMTRPHGKKNSSLNLPIIIDKLAAILEMTSVEVEEMTSKNACDFYKLNFDREEIELK